MRLFGDNSKYGKEEVALAGGKRTVGVKVKQGPAFPAGIAGLIPVISKRKKGGTKTVYAFPTAEGDAGELEQTDELSVVTDGVDLINRLLSQAAELARIELGQIGGVSMGITEANYGFTRVEIVPIDAHNKPSDAPIHLHIETSEEPGEPGSLSCVIELDEEGVPFRVLICEYNERGAMLRINVNINEKSGKLSVQKVEDILNGDARLFYKRGWTPKGLEYVEARKEGRPGGERGGKFVRKTGRAVQRPGRDEAEGEPFEGERDGRFEKSAHRSRFDDERADRRAGRPARRDEVPGMRRIDGSAAKRGGTRPSRDRDDRRSRDFDERGGRDSRGAGRSGQGRSRDFDGRDYDSRDFGERGGNRGPRGSRGGYDDRSGSRGGYRGDSRGGYDDRGGRGPRDGGRSGGSNRSGRSGGNGGSRRSY